MTKSTSAAIAALLVILLIALACGGEAGDAPSEKESSGAEKTAPQSPANDPGADADEDEPQATPEEEEPEQTPEAAPTDPERIRFKRGMSEGRITLELPANETRRYVVGVAPAQYFHIGVDDFRPVISIPNTSRLSEIDEGDNYFSAVTTKSGDIVFEISNPTRNSIKTFAIITINEREPMDH